MPGCCRASPRRWCSPTRPTTSPSAGTCPGLGRVQHAEFPMASGEMSEAAYTAFLTTSLERVESHSSDGAIAFICIDWRHLHELGY